MELHVPGELLIHGTTPGDSRFCYDEEMCDLVILFVHVIVTLARLLRRGGIRSVVAESVLAKQRLLILDVAEIKTVPYVPLSHPFVERLIGTIRRECLNRTLFWTSVDLEDKPLEFRNYYIRHRTHTSLEG